MNWMAGNKVFETEEEASTFAKALAEYGVLCLQHETDKPVTHRHLGDGMTEEV